MIRIRLPMQRHRDRWDAARAGARMGRMQTNRLDAQRLIHTYGQGEAAAPALADVSLSIGAEGPEAVAIMGR